MNTKDKIYELEIFSRFSEDSFFFHFKVDDTLEDRVKKHILKDAKTTRNIFKLSIDDEDLERLVSKIQFDKDVSNGFFHLRVDELMLHYSGEYRYLM